MKKLAIAVFSLVTLNLSVASQPDKDTLQNCKSVNDYTIECTAKGNIPGYKNDEEIKGAFHELGQDLSPAETYELDEFHGIIYPKGNKPDRGDQNEYHIKVKEDPN